MIYRLVCPYSCLPSFVTVDLEDAEEARMHLGILDMWVERVLHEVLVAEGGV